jgi:acyl-CoA reductase-like NAD-dependent aldehyde dehydrogenase
MHGFSFAGQSCISIQRVYAHREIYEDFLGRLVPKVEALKLGDPLDEETDVGPVIDEDARDRILAWIDEARGSGARVLTGGEPDEGIVRPTVLADVEPDMKVSCREVFGPVVSVAPYESLADGIELANGTEYGLQAGIFTSGIDSALEAATTLEFGGITVNEAPTFRADQMPYGGVKASGNTKEGPHYTVREMTEERLIVVGC